jgi:uncharacterized damage-inducible protein DinB
MVEEQRSLTAFYAGWDTYQGYLVEALAPRTPEELRQQVGPSLRPAWQIAAHIIATRVWWFHSVMGEGGTDLEELLPWDEENQPERSAAELEMGLERTWRMVADALDRWTPADLAATFTPRATTFTRQWVIWHVIEHDLHHGGELFLTLGMHGLTMPDL